MKVILSTISALFLAIGLNAQTYDNGGLSTGVTSNSGAAAPAGSTWSEVQNETGNTTYSNTLSGVGVTATSVGYFLADDFTVPAGEQWNLLSVTVFVYQTGYSGATSPINSLTMNIFNGDPSIATSTSVFGNDTSNALTTSNFTNIYRIFNSAVPTGTTPAANRKIWDAKANTVVSIPPGTYWIKYQLNNIANSPIFAPPVTLPGSRGLATFNGKQYVGPSGASPAVWQGIIDVGNPDALAPDVPLDMPFIITYTVTSLGTTEVREMDNRVQVYPNPTSDIFKISLPEDLVKYNTVITLHDMSGKTVREYKVADSYNISDLPSGQYMIKIKDGKSIKVTKILKK